MGPTIKLRLAGTTIGVVLAVVLAGSAGTWATASARGMTATKTCTAAQKAARKRALARYRRGMAAARRRYFRTHKNPKLRRRFVRHQLATLAKLKRAAACKVVHPPPPPPPPPPPAPPPPPGDLSVQVTPSASSVGIHATVSYTLVVKNGGNGIAHGVTLTDTLPARLGLSSRSGASGCSGFVTIRCTLGDWSPGASETLHIVARALQAGAIPNTVSVSSTSQDANPADNSATATVSVAPLPTYSTPDDPGFSFQLSKPSIADDSTIGTYPFVGEWPKTAGLFASSIGTFHGLVLFIDFPDVHGDTSAVSRDQAMRLLRATSASWYDEASYGRFHLELTPTSRWYRMSKPVADYGVDAVHRSQDHVKALAQEAIAAADPDVDFSKYDAVWLIGPYEAWQQMTILVDQRWPGGGITADGHELRRWVSAPAMYPGVADGRTSPEIFSDWVVTHESGHLLGLPDLYVTACAGCTNYFDNVGWWDILSDVPLHGHFLAWNKWLLGWLDPSQLRGLTSPGQVQANLTPSAAPGGVKAIVVPLSASMAYVVEVKARLGWESGLCDHGVLVYTVDSTKLNAQGAISIKPAHSTSSLTGCGPIPEAAYDLGPGEVSTYNDSTAGVLVQLLSHNIDGSYTVRVTKS